MPLFKALRWLSTAVWRCLVWPRRNFLTFRLTRITPASPWKASTKRQLAPPASDKFSFGLNTLPSSLSGLRPSLRLISASITASVGPLRHWRPLLSASVTHTAFFGSSQIITTHCAPHLANFQLFSVFHVRGLFRKLALICAHGKIILCKDDDVKSRFHFYSCISTKRGTQLS